MKKYIFEILPGGEIGARYLFNADTIPAQAMSLGAMVIERTITGQETPDELQELFDIYNQPESFICIDGTILRKNAT